MIFVSVWVSMHPNIPDVLYVGESDASSFLNEVVTMVIGILAPELVMLWAMRQMHMARKIAKEFKDYGWTTAHGFLCIMKGIALYEGDKFRGYIEYKSRFTSADLSIKNEFQDSLDQSRGTPMDPPGFYHAFAQLPDGTSASNRLHASGAQQVGLHDWRLGQHSLIASAFPTQPGGRPVATTRLTAACQRSKDHAAQRSTNVVAASQNGYDERDPSEPPTSTTSPATWHLDMDLGESDLEHISRPHSVETRSIGCESSGDTTGQDYSCLLHYLIARGILAIPTSEITGTLNHGDFFAKIVALFQTVWFLGKVVGRAAGGLFITELEVIALSCTCLSFVAYACWWDKPQRVRYPYRVVIARRTPGQPQFKEADPFTTRIRKERNSLKQRLQGDFVNLVQPQNRHWLEKLLLVPFYPYLFFGKQIITLMNADGAREMVPDYLFSCGISGYSTPLKIYVSLYGISVLVGTLHICRWTSPVLPFGPQLAWRINTVLVIVLPILTVATHVLIIRHIGNYRPKSEDPSAPLMDEKEMNSSGNSISRGHITARVGAMTLLHAFFLFLYITARWALIILALNAMRNLPPKALLDVQWELGFLHIG
ncbi:hypothetical protein V5O48_008445 [Marasmius crinis-equi]|uniref:Uncharacterized protein n=1 Tax=Marasmius crinis-equi TaxID=585013 RepID=A0ABR3FE37_9AGAR